MKKRILNIFLTLCILCTILPQPAAAAIIQPTEATIGGLLNAINSAASGDTIKLNANIDIPANTPEIMVTKSLTLDLNGYTISSSISGTSSSDIRGFLFYLDAGTFTITDSSASATGKITSSGKFCSLIGNRGSGTVDIKKGTISAIEEYGMPILNISKGHISISGGTVSSDLGYGIYNMATNGTVDITNGAVLSKWGLAVGNFGTLNMLGGTVSSDTYIGIINFGTCTITGGTISSNISKAINNYGHLVMTGGTLSSNTDYGLCNNSNNGSTCIADISGGTIRSISGTALMNINLAEVNISGGNIWSGGDYAIVNLSDGSVNITGGDIFAIRLAINNYSTGTVRIDAGTIAQVYNNSTGIIKINGGSIKTVTSANSPINNLGTSLVRYTLTIKDTTGTPVVNTDLSDAIMQFTPSATPTYIIDGVKTDENGRIYVWLPNNKTAVDFTLNALSVSGNIVDCTKEIVIPNFTGKVTINKDNALWKDTPPQVILCESDTNIYMGNGAINGTLSNGVYTFDGLDSAKTYYVWVKTYGMEYTGQSVTKSDASKTLDLYSISLTAGEGISSTLGDGYTVLKGSSFYIDATPVTDYIFSKWVKTSDNSQVSTTKYYNVTNISEPIKLTAKATLNLFDAKVNVNKDGSALTSGTPALKLSESSTSISNEVNVAPSSGIYTYSGLHPAKTYYVWDVTNNKYTGQTINKNTTSGAIDYYTVALTSGTGILNVTGAGIYMKGSNVTLNASVSNNYAWNCWEQTVGSTLISTSQTYTITNISSPYQLTAKASSIIFDASVTVKKDNSTWTSGTPVMKLSESSTTFAINTVDGAINNGVYTFSGLSHNKTYYVWDTTNNKYTGQIINKNTTSVVADYYTVDLTVGSGISSVTGAGIYIKGSDVSLNATPASTYLWSKWVQTSDNTNTLSTAQTYSITGINKPYSLTAMGALDLYTAKVTVNKDSSPWTGDTTAIKLSESPTSITNQVSGTLSNGEYTFTGLLRATTYYVWDNNKFTGQIINKNTTSAVLDYYSVTLSKDSRISSVTGSGIYMKGSNVLIDAVVSGTYAWSKWVQTTDGSTESITRTYTISSINKPYSLTANSMSDLGGSSIVINTGFITIEDDPDHSGRIRVNQGEATRNNIDPKTNITITGSGETTNTITVSASLGAVITLKNVNIVSPTAPFLIATSAGAVTIDLDGTNILKATSNGFAGLQKTNDDRAADGMLTIQSTTGTGSLTATGCGAGNTNGSGIGGYNIDKGGSAVGSFITITGGIITANGSYRNAGIRGDHITITGGQVTATGGSNGAGIGGGFWGNGSYITISGGTVIATGGNSAAGIGGGFAGNADHITISGGTVIAIGNTYGIGGGEMQLSGGKWFGGPATNLVITGGNINSTINGTPTNAIGGSNVYKTTFTVNGASENTDVSGGLVIRDSSGKAYGMTDVKTLDTNKVYAYLPSGDASAAYNLINYAANVSTGNNTEFVLAYTINTPDPITLDGVTAAVNFGSAFPLKAGGLSVTVNVSLSGTANKRGVYTINLQSPSVSISPTSYTKSVVIGDNVSETRAFTFTMITKDISDVVLNMTFVPTPIHTVTYTSSDATSGSLPIQAEVYEGDTYVVAGKGSLAKTGYTFAGWLNEGYAFSGTKTMGNSNVSLIAAWTANPYTVTFDPNGGTGSMSNQSFTYDQSKQLSENTFTKTGYTFSGWAKTPSGVKVYADKENVSNIIESGTTTLYALWTPNNCTVSFNANGGNGNMSNQIFTTDKAQTIAANIFTKTGYTFSGWAKTPDGAVTYTNGQSISNIAESGATTLYAKWTANNYIVVFDANGGTGTMADQSFTHDQSQPLSTNTFTKTGYTLVGWAKTPKGEMAYSDTQNTSNISESGTITLYALWTESNFIVSFDANGGIGTMMNQQFTYDVEQALSQCAFTKPGYSFAGWAQTPGGTTAYNDLQSVKNLAVSGTFNLYACWTVNTYSVSFQANGGSGIMATQSFTYDVQQSLSANAFSRPNYTFVGWATDMMGTKVYDNAQSVKNLTQSGTATLFAVWQEKIAAGINETPQSYTYDGNPKAFSLAGANGTGFSVTYMQDGNTITNPINAGKYDVTIKRVEDATYAAYNKTIYEGLVINKVSPSAFTVSTPKDTFTSFEITTKDLGVLTPSDFTITFGGTPVTATAISAYESGKYTITIPSQTADSEKVLSVKMNDTMANYSPYAVAIEVTPTVTLTNVSFSQPTLRIAQDSAQQLTLTFTPSSCTNKTVTWISDNTSIAAISSSGLVTGVKQGTTTITAISVEGNITTTCIVTVYVPTTPPSYTPSPLPNNTPEPQTGLNAPITVDGKTQNLGKMYTYGTKTTVLVDNVSFEKQLKSSADGSLSIIPISKNEIMTAHLVVKNIEEMAQKNMTLAIQSEGITYNIRTAAVDTQYLRSAFPGVETSNIAFEVTIKEASYAVAMAPSGTAIVGKPIAFNITATYGSKSIAVDSFRRFVERTVHLTDEQANKITTAVVVESNGTLRHVPTSVFQKDGKYYANIYSLTNSVYALIQNEVSFDDAYGKWYEKTVNEMASRKIISGIGDSKFAGERSITRAEFTAILVRALGLPTSGTSTFSDVSKGAWYSGVVATAAHYGLVSGIGNNKFDPSANITRQEAMAMLQRASKLTDFIGKTSALSVFTDSSSVSSWALEACKWNVGSGLIVGSNQKLRPNDNISRAETATVILRLLQKAELVDVRN